MNKKHKAKLFYVIAEDLEEMVALAHPAIEAARKDAKRGQMGSALQHLLNAEPKLYEAQALLNMNAYMHKVGKVSNKQ